MYSKTYKNEQDFHNQFPILFYVGPRKISDHSCGS